MTEKHVMIDIETLGLGPTPVILQIGAVAFDPGADEPIPPYTQRSRNHFEMSIDIDSCLDLCLRVGLHVDGSTIAWWFAQSDAARRAVMTNPRPLGSVLNAFWAWLGLHRSGDAPGLPFIWSHGAAFDVPVLEAAYRLCRNPILAVPWDHRSVRDTRTLFALAEEFAGWQKPRHETAHTALADAITQAEDVRAAYAALRAKIGSPSALELTGDRQ